MVRGPQCSVRRRPELVLDPPQAAEQVVRRKRRFRPERAVEKGRLSRRPADRRGLVRAADGGNAYLRLVG